MSEIWRTEETNISTILINISLSPLIAIGRLLNVWGLIGTMVIASKFGWRIIDRKF